MNIAAHLSNPLTELFTAASSSISPLLVPLLSTAPLAPRWLVFPLAGFSLVVVLWHLWAIIRTHMPPSRRRIRLANGLIMLMLIPLITLAFGVLAPADARPFVIAWLGVIGLLGLMVLMAMLDSANTARLHLGDRQALRDEARLLLHHTPESTDTDTTRRESSTDRSETDRPDASS